MSDSPADDLTEAPLLTTPNFTCHLHPRRESFEHGLLPIPKLIFTDGVQTLLHVKSDLLASSSNDRVNPEIVSQVLQIPIEHSRLLMQTLSAVLQDDSDSLVTAKTSEDIDAIGANVFDLLVLLYIQSYKRLLPKGHKDSAAVADVWPSTSAFDGFLSALSPLQLVRSNSRKFMPSQTDEEAHQLSYLYKHMSNILELLADSKDVDSGDSMVLSMDKFEHLGLLFYYGERGSPKGPLSQNTPFFANSDPDMPAVPVPASQVLDWLLQSISSSLDHISDRVSLRENGPSTSSDQDVAMTDVNATSLKSSSSSRGTSFIEGISKSSYGLKTPDFKGSSVKVVNCHESVIYILAPLKYATVYGCSDATIVLGAVGKAIRVEHCERVHVIAAARRVCIANCRECVFFLGVNQQPLIFGDNHKLQVAPFNTFYSQLEEHMTEADVDANINRWDEPLALGVVDPHDSLSNPAGVSDVLTESATCLDPDHYTSFMIPNWMGTEEAGSTKDNPFALPDSYHASQMKNLKNLIEVKQSLREIQLDESRKRELSSALHACFKDWLYASGNIRQLYCVHGG